MNTSVVCGVVGALALASPLASRQAVAAAPATCESLATLKAKDLTITAAVSVTPTPRDGGAAGGPGGNPGRPAGGPGGGGPGGGGPPAVAIPYCKVSGFLTPTADSHIQFEVWLPSAEKWNHKFEAVGNGGFSGALNPRAMAPGISRGYATMTTDEGHINKPEEPTEDVSWALNHPEKFIDYAYRAEHVSTIASKQIIEAYYGAAPAHSVYSGCSAGGIQGMVEMLRFPKDFDGYIIGDATPNHMSQELGAMYNTLAASLSNEAEAIKPPQIAAIHKEVLRQCAGTDGGVKTDQFLSNPMACNFDIKPVTCAAGADASTCLSPIQVTELKEIFQGPINTVTHKQILAGITPGAEDTWNRFFSGKKNPAGTERPWGGFMAYVAFSDPDYLAQSKYLKFNFGTDMATIENAKFSGQTLDAVFNTPGHDLDPIKAEGGKVIHYHGWDDPNIPALEATNFFNEVVADQEKRHHLTHAVALAETEKFYRLFMVPGMGHCAGGAGAVDFGQAPKAIPGSPDGDILSALEAWMDKGVAPEQFIGSHTDTKTKTVDFTRPVCAYPKSPVWNGTGSTTDASSFSCVVPTQASKK